MNTTSPLLGEVINSVPHQTFTPLVGDISVVLSNGDIGLTNHFDVVLFDPSAWTMEDIGAWAASLQTQAELAEGMQHGDRNEAVLAAFRHMREVNAFLQPEAQRGQQRLRGLLVERGFPDSACTTAYVARIFAERDLLRW